MLTTHYSPLRSYLTSDGRSTWTNEVIVSGVGAWASPPGDSNMHAGLGTIAL